MSVNKRSKLVGVSGLCTFLCMNMLLTGCGAASSEAGSGTTGFSLKATGAEITDVNFNSDMPGQVPQTGGPGLPDLVRAADGASVVVVSSANGIATQPVLISAETASQYAGVTTRFGDVSEGIVRVEATVSFNRLADGFFLQTSTGPTFAVVTRLIVTDSGQIQDNKTRTQVGEYAANQPFRVRMDINMSSRTFSVVIDNELNGFDDDLAVSNLPFENPDEAIPTVAYVSTDLSLFPTASLAPTTVAYDDILVLLLTGEVEIDIKPGSYPNSINPKSKGVIPVAILTDDSFDAATVDPATVRFGTKNSMTAAASFALEDVDGDRDIDMILHFRHRYETDIQCGTTSAYLTGKTFGGQQISGSDSVNTVGCK